uniref:alpha-1,3-mannosyl-glycoprotein 2-beta-N-acetylglucosaminyltransferase n=1 Tax=Parastrongyloides trichosuri TaxID=131310 RepID=A0A0N4ZRY6_PARTI
MTMWLIFITLLGLGLNNVYGQGIALPDTLAFGQLINRLEQYTQQLSRHEYVAFEQCLYYYLASESQKKFLKLKVLHPLATLPPSNNVNVFVKQITLQHFSLNEFVKDLNIVGYIELNWQDDRLKWDTTTWKTNKLQIHSASHLWLPVLSAQAFETAMRAEDTMEVRKLETTSKGNTSGLFAFSLKTICDDTDFSHYPNDVYKCCFQLEPHLNQDIIRFQSNGQPIYTDPKYFRNKGWSVAGSIPTTNNNPAEVSSLNFCINLQRSNNSIKLELSLPVVICSLLFLFAPILQVKTQFFFKLFILFLQFTTLILFNSRISPHLGASQAIPYVMRIHGFCMIMNTISIMVSGFIFMLGKIKRTLPPYSWLATAKRHNALENHLNLLTKYRNNRWNEFPIIISIDGYDIKVNDVAEKFIGKENGISKWHHNLSEGLPLKDINYRRIAEHYKYALDKYFKSFSFDTVVITEEDLDISPDFFDYFKKMRDLLLEDKTLMCVSAWNDNGMETLINKNETLLFKRTDFFPGLGWMLTRDFWLEISPTFANIYWDDFLRTKDIRKGRNCIIPEVPRTLHNMDVAGKGSSGGMYSDKLSKIKLNDNIVDYTNFNISQLKKEVYDKILFKNINNSHNITTEEILEFHNINFNSLVVNYSTPREFRRLAKKFNLMNDFRGGGIPRTAYYGIISIYYKDKRIYLIPQNLTSNSFNEISQENIYNSDWEKKNMYLEFEETFCLKKLYKLPKPCDPKNINFRKAFIKRFGKKRLNLYREMIVN